MKKLFVAFAFMGCCVAQSLPAADIAEVMQRQFPDIPGKEGLMLTVTYPPGDSGAIHRHNAHVFVFMLEGSMAMQVQGGKLVTLQPGDSFYEAPGDIHVVARNASNTAPARFVVFMVKNEGAPALIPVK